MKNKKNVFVRLILALIVSLIASNALGQTPPPRALILSPPDGLPVIPIMEGWYANDDGSYTISFGYLNRNSNETVHIPIGPNNLVEPAQFSGMQPTHFDTGRHHGVFTVTLPAEMKDQDVWWHVKTGAHPVAKVPGRTASTAYELDRKPRPQGTVQPVAWLEEGGPRGSGPDGVAGKLAQSVRVGEHLTLTVHTDDPSVRDPDDPRFKDPLPLRLTWFKHQGPGEVTFTRHADHPLVEPEEGSRARRATPGPEEVTLPEPRGTARIIATFSQPGEYMLRTRIDNWSAPESSGGDQCCWTNVYQRVSVSP